MKLVELMLEQEVERLRRFDRTWTADREAAVVPKEPSVRRRAAFVLVSVAALLDRSEVAARCQEQQVAAR